MDTREQAREAAAKTIIENMPQYSFDEIINAVRFLGRIGNVSELIKILFPPLVTVVSLNHQEEKSLIQLETIKQIGFHEYPDLLFNVLKFSPMFQEVHLNEVIRIAGNMGYFDLLKYVIEHPNLYATELRKKANEELFKNRGGKGFVALDYVKESIDRGKDNNMKTESNNLKQVFISYKKSDQMFASEVVSYLSEFYNDEFEILYDEIKVVAGDSLPKVLNEILDRSETSLMVWSPDYFSESGWAQVEKDGILSKRVREGKRFVPLFLRGESSIIPTLFSQYVYVDFREYEKNRDPVLFRRQMEKVIVGLRK